MLEYIFDVIVNVLVISKLFSETNGYVYINLQLSTYINDFCYFFGTIKLIHLCRFNQRIYLFI